MPDTINCSSKEVNIDVFYALASMYVSLHLLDLENDTRQTIHSHNFLEALMKEDQGASEAMRSVMQSICTDECREDMLKFTELSTLVERMKETNLLSNDFVSVLRGWVRAHFIVVSRNEQGAVKKVLFAVEYIDVAKRKEIKLQELSELDGLTSITNRYTGERRIAELLNSGHPGMFCILDIDNFKEFNDKYGHQVGDEVLIKVANCLKESLRGNDCTMRLGGDEFAFYAVGIRTPENAQECLSRLMQKMDAIYIDNVAEKISISLGAVLCPAVDKYSFEQVYRRADQKLYESKKQIGSHFEIIWGDI